LEDALAAYNSEIAALRSEGVTRTLSIAGVEQLFTLGVAFEQMHRTARSRVPPRSARGTGDGETVSPAHP
jgi:hypothetical protein